MSQNLTMKEFHSIASFESLHDYFNDLGVYVRLYALDQSQDGKELLSNRVHFQVYGTTTSMKNSNAEKVFTEMVNSIKTTSDIRSIGCAVWIETTIEELCNLSEKLVGGFISA